MTTLSTAEILKQRNWQSASASESTLGPACGPAELFRGILWVAGFLLIAAMIIGTWRWSPLALRSDLDEARKEIATLKARMDALEKK